MSFVDILKADLQYPKQHQRLFDNIENPEQIAQMLKNKDCFVAEKINSSKSCLNGNISEKFLDEKGFIRKTGVGEFVVSKEFTIKCSLLANSNIVKGPVGFEKNVVVGRSTIFGPAFISEGSKIYDSLIRGGSNGSVYIGGNCNLWDHTVVNRSFIDANSLIHTGNLNDSIIGPRANFGGVRLQSNLKLCATVFEDIAALDRRIILTNFSYGNKISILNPITDKLVQSEADHLGTIAGSGVWLGSGTIVYPGTIIGSEAKINCSLPLIGYFPPKKDYSLFLSVRKNEKDEVKIELKGSMKSYLISLMKT